MQKVAVFFGGNSCEREISILTGVFVMNVLNGGKFSPLPIYVHSDGKTYTSPKMLELDFFKKTDIKKAQRIFFDGHTVYELKDKKSKIKRIHTVDVALNCCHGGLGEGGGVSALTAWHTIPLASPDLTSSGVFMDKCTTKLIMRALNVPTVDFIRVNQADYEKRGAFLLKNIGNRLKYPVVIKPAHLGSSIGIMLAKNETEVKKGIESAFLLDDRVIIEKYLPEKQDINCAVYAMNGEIFLSEAEKAFEGGIYSFEEKYVKKKGEEIGKFSQNKQSMSLLKGELRDKIRSYARTVYKRMNLQGVVRMDFLVSEGKAYLCEVNTVPGSLAYYLFCERITDARRFFEDLLQEALKNAEKSEKQVVTTGILDKVERMGK